MNGSDQRTTYLLKQKRYLPARARKRAARAAPPPPSSRSTLPPLPPQLARPRSPPPPPLPRLAVAAAPGPAAAGRRPAWWRSGCAAGGGTTAVYPEAAVADDSGGLLPSASVVDRRCPLPLPPRAWSGAAGAGAGSRPQRGRRRCWRCRRCLVRAPPPATSVFPACDGVCTYAGYPNFNLDRNQAGIEHDPTAAGGARMATKRSIDAGCRVKQGGNAATIGWADPIDRPIDRLVGAALSVRWAVVSDDVANQVLPLPLFMFAACSMRSKKKKNNKKNTTTPNLNSFF